MHTGRTLLFAGPNSSRKVSISRSGFGVKGEGAFGKCLPGFATPGSNPPWHLRRTAWKTFWVLHNPVAAKPSRIRRRPDIKRDGSMVRRMRHKTFMFLIAIIAWAVGVIVSFSNGNRKLPVAVLLIGLVLLFAPIGVFGTAGIALLAAIIWIANKADMG